MKQHWMIEKEAGDKIFKFKKKKKEKRSTSYWYQQSQPNNQAVRWVMERDSEPRKSPRVRM